MDCKPGAWGMGSGCTSILQAMQTCGSAGNSLFPEVWSCAIARLIRIPFHCSVSFKPVGKTPVDFPSRAEFHIDFLNS